MAKQKPNIFVVIDCKKRKNLMVTSSARKAKNLLEKGVKVEIWSENRHVETVYFRLIRNLDKYVSLEKQYIAEKQANATKRNQRRRKSSGL